MPSQLTFDATESFRKKLLLKNLPPYREALQGDDKPGTDEFRVKDSRVFTLGRCGLKFEVTIQQWRVATRKMSLTERRSKIVPWPAVSRPPKFTDISRKYRA